ncbi:MAG: chorismate mutase [Dethiobacteria bacterium]|jgi:chorismate mutase|nr:chorismate mutase [Bacillota bacterium]
MSNCVRGIRGAINVDKNSTEDILSATRELLQRIVEENEIKKEDIAAVFFSTTSDLNAAFPAQAARQLGWHDVPLFCSQEIDVPNSLPLCIRILMLVNTVKKQSEIIHIYLRGASKLRPDLS